MRSIVLSVLAVAIAAPLHAQAANGDDANLESDKAPQWTYGTTVGASHLWDYRQQQSFGAVGRYHVTPNVSIAVTPAYAIMSFPASAGGGSSSGLTDMPVDLSYDHEVPGSRGVSIGAELGVSLPVGDTATGFGSGRVGYSISGGIGASPMDNLSLHLGAGKPLSDFSFGSTLGGSSSTWADAEANYQLNDRLGLTGGFDGDLTSADTLGAPRALTAGLSYAVAGPLTLSLAGSHGVSGPAATWSFSLGFGTDFAWVGTVASTSALQRLAGSMAGLSHSNGRGNTTYSGHSRGKP